MDRVIFWDFDGTLVYRPKMFSTSLIMVLDKYEAGHNITGESIVRWIQSGFPWLEPEGDYRDFCDTEIWWAKICRIFEQAFLKEGISPEKACKYARETRELLAASQYYNLYDDTIETLKFFKDNGYRNIILSNHIPELPEIAEKLGLMDYMEVCITSAKVGYEKPNPRIFEHAVQLAGNPEEVWMVGDNPAADVRGAEAAGIKAILVRKQDAEPTRYYSPDLRGVIRHIVPSLL